MDFETVRELTAGIPFILPENARQLYDLVLQEELADCLELGFAHGVGSCFIAAALDELGRGHLTSVDLLAGQEWQTPNIEELLARCYRSCLELARQWHLETVGFPAISTGAYGFPLELATNIALAEARTALEREPELKRLVFCCYSKGDLAVYDAVAGRVFRR